MFAAWAAAGPGSRGSLSSSFPRLSGWPAGPSRAAARLPPG